LRKDRHTFAESPEDRADAFSEILSEVTLNGAAFFSAEFPAPWGFSAPASEVMAATIAPWAEPGRRPASRVRIGSGFGTGPEAAPN
jgi:hypothetical protein